jgi:DNA-binding transcriptional regulator YdaS (Cro superfamily)
MDPKILQAAAERAINAAGGPTKLAALLKIKQAAVSQWRRIPAERVGRVATITGIPPHDLRPDLFPQPEAAQ